jgi:hypothetical protein
MMVAEIPQCQNPAMPKSRGSKISRFQNIILNRDSLDCPLFNMMNVPDFYDNRPQF